MEKVQVQSCFTTSSVFLATELPCDEQSKPVKHFFTAFPIHISGRIEKLHSRQTHMKHHTHNSTHNSVRKKASLNCSLEIMC